MIRKKKPEMFIPLKITGIYTPKGSGVILAQSDKENTVLVPILHLMSGNASTPPHSAHTTYHKGTCRHRVMHGAVSTNLGPAQSAWEDGALLPFPVLFPTGLKLKVHGREFSAKLVRPWGRGG